MNRDNCKAIHETALKDIMNLYDSLKSVTKENLGKKQNGPMAGMSSLAKASSNLTLVFPVICSRGIAIENAAMISKAVEKNAVTMLQRLMASWQIADAKDVNNLNDYIKQFHQNVSTRAASLDDIFELGDRMEVFKHEGSVIENATMYSAYEAAIIRDRKNLDYYLPDAVSESSLMAYSVKEGIVSEADNYYGLSSFEFKKAKEEYEEKKKAYEDAHKDDKNAVAYEQTDEYHDSKYASAIRSNHASSKFKDISDARKNSTDYFKNQVVDADFKKANELMPTSLTVNFSIVDNDKIIPYTNGVIGVKAKLYPIGSDDIVRHIAEKDTAKNGLINFIRATTREISFMKDFVLAIDKAKIDAMSMSVRKNTSDKMWKVLERRATTSRLKRALRQNNNAAAITTLAVSQEEVEYLRKNHNIDLERIGTIMGLFESLNLMCVCIVDESLEVAKFIFDEDEPMWETISFTHLERESSDNTYKRVVNLMTKMSR